MNRPDQGLPTIYERLVPELAGVEWSSEPLATCSSCAMKTNPTPQFDAPHLFTSPANCCTYHPRLPNYLVGRALRRGDEGTVRMLRRMSTPQGVIAGGVIPHAGHNSYFVKMRTPDPDEWFGRSKLVCPFWVSGPHPCTIYADRNGVCRTWFCKHDQGTRGFHAWKRLQLVMDYLEDLLAERCIANGKPPEPKASRAEFVDWYLWCAEYVDGLTDADLADLTTPDLLLRRTALNDQVVRRDMALPDVVIPSVQDFSILGDDVRFSTYSGFDQRVFHKELFAFFSHLDGKTTWREALAATSVDIGRDLGEPLIDVLWRFGLLSVPEEREWKPGWEMSNGESGTTDDEMFKVLQPLEPIKTPV